VIDKETGEVLPFVKIQLEGKDIYTTTDFDGIFKIKYPLNGMEKVNLIFTSLGYQAQTILDIVLRENKITIVDIEMTDETVLTAFYVTVPSKREERKAKKAQKKEQ
jgi:hypothetical protein